MFINFKMSVCNTHTEHDAIHAFKQGVHNLTQQETPVELCILMAQLLKIIFSNSTLHWYGNYFSQSLDLCSLTITKTDLKVHRQVIIFLFYQMEN